MLSKIKRFQIKDKAIDSSKIQDESLIDTHISNGADIQQSKIQDLPSTLNSKVSLSGDTMTGILTLHDHPTQPLHAATKYYTEQTIATAGQIFEQVSYINLDSPTGNLEIGPHGIGVGSGQFSATSVFISLSDSSNFEAGNQTPGVYYIYATGTGFKLSLAAPTFINGAWLRSNSNPWKYIGSVISKTAGTFIPFLKTGQNVFFKNRQTITAQRNFVGTFNPQLLAPSTTSFGIIVFEMFIVDSHYRESASGTMSILDPDFGTEIDRIAVSGTVGQLDSNNFLIYDDQMIFTPVKIVSGIPQCTFRTTLSRANSTAYFSVFQVGYTELV